MNTESGAIEMKTEEEIKLEPDVWLRVGDAIQVKGGVYRVQSIHKRGRLMIKWIGRVK